MQVGFIGLGKMGSRMVKKLFDDGHEVIIWSRSISSGRLPTLQDDARLSLFTCKSLPRSLSESRPQSSKVNKDKTASAFNSLASGQPAITIAKTIKDLVQKLEKPRVIWVMVPAGEATEEVLSELKKYVEKGDILVDGGNSYFKDTEKRFNMFKKKNIRFLGIGVSGGVHGEKDGYALMAGGDRGAYDSIVQLLDCLSKPRGSYDYLGVGGAGHFVKMVHNGIEYGMMQSIGEGFTVLKKSSYKFDLLKIAKTWQRGTIISGFLIDRAKDALEADAKLSGISGNIPRGGEGDWTVEAAKEEKVAVEIIKESVKFRKKSETDSRIQNSYTAKMINALRHQFGGHEVKKK